MKKTVLSVVLMVALACLSTAAWAQEKVQTGQRADMYNVEPFNQEKDVAIKMRYCGEGLKGSDISSVVKNCYADAINEGWDPANIRCDVIAFSPRPFCGFDVYLLLVRPKTEPCWLFSKVQLNDVLQESMERMEKQLDAESLKNLKMEPKILTKGFPGAGACPVQPVGASAGGGIGESKCSPK
jgi:hypothetical protein